MIQLFSAGPRRDTRPPYPKESAFAYLDRSARPEADKARSLIEAWLADYPAAGAAHMAERLRSRRDEAHRSAFFELMLHRLLPALGHQIAAVEPRLAHSWRSPDFLVERSFYLEAIVAQGGDLHAALKRKAGRYGELDLPLVVAVSSPVDEAGLSRALDELWIGPRGPQRRILSAVLAFGPVDPLDFRAGRIRLVRHPEPAIPLPRLALGDGQKVGDLLG